MKRRDKKINLPYSKIENDNLYLKSVLEDFPNDIKKMCIIKKFVLNEENKKLFLKALKNTDIKDLEKLNNNFRTFLKRQAALYYVMGIIKRYPIDYDKRVNKRNNRNSLILDKPLDNNDSSATFLDQLKDPNEVEDLASCFLEDSIFPMNYELENAIYSLKPNQKKILKLIYADNYSQREVSKILDQTEQNIHYWHKKTLNQLGKVLLRSEEENNG